MATIKPYREKLPTPPREVVCKRCSVKFYVKTPGLTKYCVECKVVIFKEHQVQIQDRRREKRRLAKCSRLLEVGRSKGE